MKRYGNKVRIQLLLSAKAYNTLEDLFKNARRSYGHNASRSKIIEELISKTGDPIKRREEEKRQLVIRINQLDQEIQDIETTIEGSE